MRSIEPFCRAMTTWAAKDQLAPYRSRPTRSPRQTCLHGSMSSKRNWRCGADFANIASMPHPSISVTEITKRFGATAALDRVSFAVMPGEIHALVGKNGAGKSTLVRIFGGALRPDHGDIAIDGVTRRL